MSGTMGDSTRTRLAGLVRAANAGGGGDRAPGAYIGGYGGGMGGTWSKAPTNRGILDQPKASEAAGGAGGGGGGGPARPSSAGRQRPNSAGGMGGTSGHGAGAGAGGTHGNAQGVRDRIKPASAGVKSAWDEAPKSLPRAPPHGLTSTRPIKPASATLAGGRTTKPLTGIGMDLKTPGTGQMEAVGGGLASTRSRAGAGGGGGGGGGIFGSPGGPRGRETPKTFVSYDTGPVPMGRAAYAQQHPSPPEQQMSGMPLSNSGYTPFGDAGSAPEPTEAGLAMLEDQIRDALRARRSVYEDSKTMLLKMFKAVDDGSGDVSWDEFCAICSQLDVPCSLTEVQRLFERFGYKDRLPYTRFAHVLLTQPSRQLAEELPTRAGPFRDVMAADFHGKVRDKRCRKPLYTPSNWDPKVDAARSAELPNARLVLQFVYGFNGKDATSQNLFYNAAGQPVYFVAGVGVVYTPRGSGASTGSQATPASTSVVGPGGHSQHFFLGHTDDIKAMAVCNAEVDVNGRKYPAKTVVATAQVSSHDEGAYICVWDSRLGSQQGEPQLVRLSPRKDKEDRGFSALGFSPDGVYLTAVANDNSHTVYVYDWRRSRLVDSGKGQMGDPPQVYGVEWNPHAGRYPAVPHAFLTFGKKHIKMWTSEGGRWAPKQLTTGRLDMQNVHSAAWLPPRQEGSADCLVVAGMADGQLYIFKGTVAVKSIAAHAKGPQAIQPDGHVAYTGVRGMRLVETRDSASGAVTGRVLLSGGADSTILRWDVSDGSLAEGRFAGPPLVLRSSLPDRGHSVRALDYDVARGVVLVGTNQCNIMEVTETSQDVLVYGHCDDVWAVAWHPTQPHRAATVSDKVVYVWDVEARHMERSAVVGFAARAVAFSTRALEPDGATHHIAVGGAKGDLMVLLEGTLQPVHKAKDSREGITDIKYSPDCRLMAAATADTWIDIYSVTKGYQRVQRCTGHSSTVRGIDWSTDSSILQSDSADMELLVWNARTGKQIPIPSRDVQYATYTLRLGFPVMGIWPDYSDGTDVNAVHRSAHGDLLATCDDDGLVKLFNCPCVLDDAPHRAYRGHSSHVMGVRFNCTDSTVVSVGGYDWGMFQFAVVQLEAVEHGPNLPQKVWGALDPEGRSYGWTFTPYDVRQGGAQDAVGAPAAAPAGGRAALVGGPSGSVAASTSQPTSASGAVFSKGPGARSPQPMPYEDDEDVGEELAAGASVGGGRGMTRNITPEGRMHFSQGIGGESDQEDF